MERLFFVVVLVRNEKAVFFDYGFCFIPFLQVPFSRLLLLLVTATEKLAMTN